MRVLLVTSQVTYIPNNYRGILDALFEKSAQHIAGLVLLTTLNSTWLKSWPVFMPMGVIELRIPQPATYWRSQK